MGLHINKYLSILKEKKWKGKKMLQRIYEFLLYHSIDNTKIYNFLIQAFPRREQSFLDRMEKKIAGVYIPEDEMEQMQIDTKIIQKGCYIRPWKHHF